ncbi:MAG: hypothetical protein ACI9EF_002011 [Pseudohongiellaceae bacterium]|jgi:hypothetical protein
MSLINWIFDAYQHHRIETVTREAQSVRSELRELRASGGRYDDARLERALGELALARKTMQRVLVDKGICSADDFADTKGKIDAEDGRIDGQSPI